MINKVYHIKYANEKELDFTDFDNEITKLRKESREKRSKFFKSIAKTMVDGLPFLKGLDVQSYGDGVLFNEIIFISIDNTGDYFKGKTPTWKFEWFIRNYKTSTSLNEVNENYTNKAIEVMNMAQETLKVISNEKYKNEIVKLMTNLYVEANLIEIETNKKVENIEDKKRAIRDRLADEVIDWIAVGDDCSNIIAKGKSKVVKIDNDSISYKEGNKIKKVMKESIRDRVKFLFTVL